MESLRGEKTTAQKGPEHAPENAVDVLMRDRGVHGRGAAGGWERFGAEAHLVECSVNPFDFQKELIKALRYTLGFARAP